MPPLDLARPPARQKNAFILRPESLLWVGGGGAVALHSLLLGLKLLISFYLFGFQPPHLSVLTLLEPSGECIGRPTIKLIRRAQCKVATISGMLLEGKYLKDGRMHTRTHAFKYKHTHTHTHAHAEKDANMYTLTHMHTHTHMGTSTHSRTCTHTHTHALMCIHRGTFTHTHKSNLAKRGKRKDGWGFASES